MSTNHNHIMKPEDSVTFAQYMAGHRQQSALYTQHNTLQSCLPDGPVAVVGMTGLVTSRAQQIFCNNFITKDNQTQQGFQFFVELQSRACRGYRECRECRDRSARSSALVPLIQFPAMPARAPV